MIAPLPRVGLGTDVHPIEANEVRRVHTGFDGPATSRYEAFRKDFDELIESLRR